MSKFIVIVVYTDGSDALICCGPNISNVGEATAYADGMIWAEERIVKHMRVYKHVCKTKYTS